MQVTNTVISSGVQGVSDNPHVTLATLMLMAGVWLTIRYLHTQSKGDES